MRGSSLLICLAAYNAPDEKTPLDKASCLNSFISSFLINESLWIPNTFFILFDIISIDLIFFLLSIESI